jgi:hypothetical protein
MVSPEQAALALLDVAGSRPVAVRGGLVDSVEPPQMSDGPAAGAFAAWHGLVTVSVADVVGAGPAHQGRTPRDHASPDRPLDGDEPAAEHLGWAQPIGTDDKQIDELDPAPVAGWRCRCECGWKPSSWTQRHGWSATAAHGAGGRARRQG